MNTTLRFHSARWTDAVVTPAVNSLTSICVAACAFVFSGVSMAQQAPQKAPAAPGTAVVASGAHPRRLELDEVPPGTYDVNTKETLVRYGVDHMGFSEFWGTFPGANGTLVFDPKAIGAANLDVKVPISQVDTTKPIVLDVTFHGAGTDPFTGRDIMVGFDAKGMVKRSDFGLGKYVPIVSDETTITISAEFKKRAVDHS